MKEGSDSHERDGEQRTDDGDGVEDVPHVAAVRAWVKQHAAIHHLHSTDDEAR